MVWGKDTSTLEFPTGYADAPAARPHVLVLDDQDSIRSLLGDVLEAHGFRASLCRNLTDAEELIQRERFDAIIVDIFLENMESGLSLLPRIKDLQPHTPTIIISGMASMDHVIEALKAGAYDMIVKPFNIIDVIHVVTRAVDKKRMAEENVRLVQALRQERDRLEERVEAATQGLKENIETLRLLNQQLATMFEMSQMNTGDGSSAGIVRRVFELLHRMIDFEGACCVVYDVVAREVTFSHAEGETMGACGQELRGVFQNHIGRLIEVAESQSPLPIEEISAAIHELYPGAWPEADVMLMPLYVPQTLMGVVGLLRRQRSAHLTQSEERILAIAIAHFLAAFERRGYIARTGQLAGLGELISEIAHDLRHPMTALRGASRILLDGWREEGRRNRCLDEIQGNLVRMESLVSELVNFYNPKDMNMVPVDLHGLLDKALAVSQFVLEQKQIQVERRYEAAPVMILGLTRNLVEAFVNLISNACQAMAPGGRLILGVRAVLDEAHAQRVADSGRLPGHFVMATVEDNGSGIPVENRDRIFRRFFTTRPEGHGLGLSAVQRIVKKNLGHIHWESTVDQGTVFYLYLPKA